MAALVYFRKASEDSNQVHYDFGDDPGNFSRRLTVAKDSHTSVADDGRVDYTFLKASRKINSLREESGLWPERGMSVS
ncbi:hypothetical protein [Streptomyces sp. G-G2]|uniref:hypothetical protein n=1 Tax=Streptomyces sp. G-G2 TaxID=3046201 RepID=UPI0024BB0441|nr:hypothetical protein [Streptomyces sp. G-G2]MDJ0386037.1 hypothetical protein [Streptomyces sp. G-G2]